MRRLLSLPNTKTTSPRVSALLALLALFCGLAAGQQEKPSAEPLGSELAKAPAAAASWTNPYAGQDKAILAGKKLYQRHCAGCHGSDGRGGEKAPDLHTPVIQNAPPGVLFWFLKNGDLKEGMPSWSRLPDQRLWQLVSYLQTLMLEEEPAETQPGPVPPKDPPSLP